MNISQAEQKYVDETKDGKPKVENYAMSLSYEKELRRWYERFSLWLLKQNEELRTGLIDMINLASGLNEDDSWFGERRNADERIKKAEGLIK